MSGCSTFGNGDTAMWQLCQLYSVFLYFSTVVLYYIICSYQLLYLSTVFLQTQWSRVALSTVFLYGSTHNMAQCAIIIQSWQSLAITLSCSNSPITSQFTHYITIHRYNNNAAITIGRYHCLSCSALFLVPLPFPQYLSKHQEEGRQ